ncbi:MAG TPA: hypothetical protein VJC39_03200 [Candidatus Nanoarchaeia archaeon]|nr:hypothetical protein [Candidatus Nanoarchaeia archaeon]
MTLDRKIREDLGEIGLVASWAALDGVATDFALNNGYNLLNHNLTAMEGNPLLLEWMEELGQGLGLAAYKLAGVAVIIGGYYLFKKLGEIAQSGSNHYIRDPKFGIFPKIVTRTVSMLYAAGVLTGPVSHYFV